MPSESTVQLGVVIPVYNEEAKIEACLAALPPLVEPLLEGRAHVATGTRLPQPAGCPA